MVAGFVNCFEACLGIFYEVNAGVGWVMGVDDDVAAVLGQVFSETVGVEEYHYQVAV